MKKKCNFHCPILIVTHVYSSPDTALKFKKLAEKNSRKRGPNDMMTGGFCFCSHLFSYLARLISATAGEPDCAQTWHSSHPSVLQRSLPRSSPAKNNLPPGAVKRRLCTAFHLQAAAARPPVGSSVSGSPSARQRADCSLCTGRLHEAAATRPPKEGRGLREQEGKGEPRMRKRGKGGTAGEGKERKWRASVARNGNLITAG